MSEKDRDRICADDFVICPKCDTLHKRILIHKNMVAKCSECGKILYGKDDEFIRNGIAYAITGIILFLVAVLFPLIKINAFGHENYVSVLSMVRDLCANSYYMVATIIFFVLILFPVAIHFVYLLTGFLLLNRSGDNIRRYLLVFLSKAAPWNMVDIFLISILVTAVKLTGYVQIEFGAAFWALVLFVATDLMLGTSVKMGEMWEIHKYTRYGPEQNSDAKSVPDMLSGSEGKFVRCKICEAVNIDRGKDMRCRRCGGKIHGEFSGSVAKAWAFLITAVIFYFPANIYPVLISKEFGQVKENTIIGGIILLWNEGSWFVASVILIASVFVPVLKFLLLSYLLVNVRKPLTSSSKSQQHRLYYLSEIIGPWSMIDIFVVAILAGLVHMGSFQMEAGPGARAFVLMVIFTLFSAYSIDTRFFREKETNRRCQI